MAGHTAAVRCVHISSQSAVQALQAGDTPAAEVQLTDRLYRHAATQRLRLSLQKQAARPQLMPSRSSAQKPSQRLWSTRSASSRRATRPTLPATWTLPWCALAAGSDVCVCVHATSAV